MMTPDAGQKKPYVVEVESGKTYHWCACGSSKKRPYCDGSHKGTAFAPVAYVAAQTGKLGICACGHSKNLPLCDGSHKAL